MKKLLAILLTLALLCGLSSIAEEEPVSGEIEPAVPEIEMELGGEAALNDEIGPTGEIELGGDVLFEEGGTEAPGAEETVGDAVLTVNGVSYDAEALKENFYGQTPGGERAPWKWLAYENTLKLERFAGEEGGLDIIYRGERLRLRADGDNVITSLRANDVDLEAPSSTTRVGVMDVRDLRITGGFIDARCAVRDSALQYRADMTRDYGDEPGLHCRSLYLKGMVGCVNPVVDGAVTVDGSDTGMADYYYTLSVAGTLNAGQVSMTGNKLEVQKGIVCREFSQTGGFVTAGRMQVEGTLAATGGTLTVSNDNPSETAIRANRLVLGGKVMAYLEDDSHLLDVNALEVNGLEPSDDVSTELLMNNGRYRRYGDDLTGVLSVGDDAFTQYELDNTDLGDGTWRWDHVNKRLILCGFEKTGAMISSVNALDIVVQGGSNNYLESIYLSKGGTITGGGTLQAEVLASAAVKVEDCRFNGTVYATGDVRFKNVESGSAVTLKGDVIIENCDIEDAVQIVADGDLIIRDSFVKAADGLKEDAGLFATGKVVVSNSLIMCSNLYGEGGSSIDKNTAAFVLLREGASEYYVLAKSAKLKKSFDLPYDEYYIPKGVTLTVSKGCTLSIPRFGLITRVGKVKGKFYERESYPGNVSVTGSTHMVVGGSQKLTAKYDSGERVYRTRWVSSDPWLASVDMDGVVTITADAASHIGETVTVYAYPNEREEGRIDITIAAGTRSIAVRCSGEGITGLELWQDPARNQAKLEAMVEPAEASGDVVWKCQNAKIVSIGADSVVKAGKPGTTTVWAEAADGTGITSKKITVTVLKAPGSVKVAKTMALDFDPYTGTGSSAVLSAKLPAGTASTLTYSGYDKNVVRVDGDGTVTAVGFGKTKVTVSAYNKKKAVCTVTVVNPYAPTGIKLNRTGTVKMSVGETLSLEAALTPATAVDTLKWTSSKAGVASVENGVVTALKKGSATITVTTSNGKSAKVKIKVS